MIPLGVLAASRAGPTGPAYRSRLQFAGADGATAFADDTGKIWTAFGNAQIDTSLGDQRGIFDGAGDYITTPNAANLNFGTSDFSIKFGMRFASKAGFQTIFSKGYVGNQVQQLLLQTGNGDGRLNFYGFPNGGTLVLLAGETTGTVNAGQDYEIEVRRAGNLFSILRDGMVVGSGTRAINFVTTGEFSIGGGSASGFNNYWFNGWLKDFRIE